MRLKAVKKAAACAAALMTVGVFGTNAFSLVDFTVGESGLVNNADMLYKVNIVAEDKIAAVVPIGVGVRGDADGNGKVAIYDAIKIARSIVGSAGNDFKGSLGYAMADCNQDGKVNIYDAINIARYIIASGSSEERWDKVLKKNDTSQ